MTWGLARDSVPAPPRAPERVYESDEPWSRTLWRGILGCGIPGVASQAVASRARASRAVASQAMASRALTFVYSQGGCPRLFDLKAVESCCSSTSVPSVAFSPGPRWHAQGQRAVLHGARRAVA